MEWIRGSAAIWLPIGIGLLAALFGGAFLTAGRLRRDLAADSQLLQTLPIKGRAAGHLNASIQGRVFRLVSLTRYPSVAATDLLGVFGVLVAAATVTIEAYLLVGDPKQGSSLAVVLATALMVLGFAYGSWRLFYDGWSRRAIARFQFLSRLLDEDELEDLAKLLGAANTMISLAAWMLVVVPSGVLIVVSLNVQPTPAPAWLSALCFLFWVAVIGVAVVVPVVMELAEVLTPHRKLGPIPALIERGLTRSSKLGDPR